MKTILLALATALLALFCSDMNAQNQLTVRVNNLDNSKGTLMIALFDSQAKFLSPQVKRAQSLPVGGTTVDIIFDDLAEGEYAIALYQDSNNNKDLDLGQYGIPTEKYGFSNDIDPAVILGVPTFDACKFKVKGDTSIEIKAVSAVSK